MNRIGLLVNGLNGQTHQPTRFLSRGHQATRPQAAHTATEWRPFADDFAPTTASA